jgi:hypothetical protein
LEFISLAANDPNTQDARRCTFQGYGGVMSIVRDPLTLLRLQFLLHLDKAPISEHNSAQVLSKLLLLLLWEPQTRPPFRLNISDTAESEAVP